MKFKNPVYVDDRASDPSPNTNLVYAIGGFLKWAGNKVLTYAHLDTDGTLAANSDDKIPSQKAVRTYVSANSGGSGISGGKVFALKSNVYLI